MHMHWAGLIQYEHDYESELHVTELNARDAYSKRKYKKTNKKQTETDKWTTAVKICSLKRQCKHLVITPKNIYGHEILLL